VHRAAVELDLTRVLLQRAAEDFHQRGLARAVLAEEGVDLAGKNDEICFGKSLRLAEALRDAPQFERRI
jgi:hypothetical protein